MSIKIKNVTKRYGEHVVLDDFSYEFSDAGLYALSGPSGVGKTTLLRIICGLDKDYEGTVEGVEADDFSYCFQEYRLFPRLSVLKNILLLAYKRADENDVKNATSMLSRLSIGANEMALLPNQLSGGMKQRVSFVRAVLRDSKVLLLDEPTKELDESITKEMLEIIVEESKKRLVILVTHKLDELERLPAAIVKIGAQN